MEKQEFLKILRESLSGEVPEQEVSNSVRYYEEYLTDDAGKSLEEKLKELGEPRLIAKTIIDTYLVNHEDTDGNFNYNSYRQSYEEEYSESSHSEGANGSKIRYYSWNTMTWYQKLIALVVGCILVSVIVSVLMLGVNIFFRLVFPIMLVLFGIRMIRQLFR